MASASLASSPFLPSLLAVNPNKHVSFRLPARRLPVAASAAPSGAAAAARERQQFLERYGLNPDDFEDDAEEDPREERRDRWRQRSGRGEDAAEASVVPTKAAEPQETHKMLQVLGGKVRRRKLLSPKGRDVRPMMEVVRGAAFDILQSAGGSPASLRPGRWLDLYSGTGSVGIEAMSRGCSEQAPSSTMSSASPDSVAVDYDPATDKRRKANSDDLGWKYGYWADLTNKDVITCTIYTKTVPGGIKRFKQHLAGGYGDVKMCAKVSTEIRREIIAYIESKKKKKRPLFLDDEDDDVVEVAAPTADVAEATNVVSSQLSIAKVPSSGTAAKRRNATFQSKAKAASSSKANAKPKQTKSVVAMLRRTPEEIVDQRRSGSFQRTIEASTKTPEEKHYVDMQWALWFIECGVAFNASSSKQFAIALEATAQYGSGYTSPTPYQFGEPLLEDCVKLTSTMREDHEKAWKQYGCTLMSDGWTDMKGRHLINFLVNSPEGTYFLESIDASSETHDATMLAGLLEERIQDIGKDKVVQIVTDNGANYKAAGKILMERIPTLFWSPCATHCLNLMLEEIGSLKYFKAHITRARRVTNFIYRHGRILSAMRDRTGQQDLVRAGKTRFATSFLTLKSLHKHKDALRNLFGSEEWIGNKLAKTRAGEHVHDVVLSLEFWNSIEDCLRVSAPLLIVLRAADGDVKPAMPEVAALMVHAKEKIKLSFDIPSKRGVLEKIMEIIDRRWVNQMGHPLYGAALYLNLGKFFPLVQADDDATIGQVRGSFLEVLSRMVEDEGIRDNINRQAIQYESQQGACFSNKMAIQSIKTMSPVDWWRSYGGRAIDLQRFAKRIVGLCASASGCERNWSTFNQIHTKKRNRFLHKRLNDIVFVLYNRKMKTRFQILREKAGKIDPLVIEDFNWDNKWADSSYVPTDDVPWSLVDEAVGASHALQGRHVPRRAHKRSRGGPMVYVRRSRVEEEDLDEQDEDSCSGNEEEEDPCDDADVSDCEEAPNVSNDMEENGAAAADEFDDGY